MSKFNVYEVEEDYTWICAVSPERAKEIYKKYYDWTEKDWLKEEEVTVCPVYALEPLSVDTLDKLTFKYEDGHTQSFTEKLKTKTKEGVFAFANE